jgi:acyl transferase domain-containing protein
MSLNLETTNYRELLQKALVELKKMRSQLNTREQIETEPIALIGMGCRFPGAGNPESFWQLLHNGVDAISEVPASRWNIDTFYDPNPATLGKMNTRWGGFLEQVDEFDPQFFGISPREAESIDPQQRLLLETSWEALENAGIAPHKLRGSNAGVFVGISSNDYSRLQFSSQKSADAYFGTGNALCIAANRLSYSMDFRGPSLAVDTACSSSLVAVHQACQSLRRNECQLALAGGVNLILSPDLTISFSQARMLSSDGRCKTFDASADGYVRGEGGGIVVLKKVSDALRDEDNILAVIKGSAINQDGHSNGLTAPNGRSQQAVIREALKFAKVQPNQINYVEAHGTGTSLGDPIEVNSLKELLMEGRKAVHPCWIGSVKTNIGHLEAASGIASLIKVVLSLQHEEIPPHLHFQRLNHHISLDGTPLLIPTKSQQWSRGQVKRLAGVSSFGFGGTNAHIVLQENSLETIKTNEQVGENKVDRPWHLLTLSAQNKFSLADLVKLFKAYLQSHPEASLADICFTANTGRDHFKHRLAIAAESTVQLQSRLAVIADNNNIETLPGLIDSKKLDRVAFLFTGQGSQYVNMGRQLYQTQPFFRQTIDQCAEILRPYLDKSLIEVLYPQAAEVQNSSLASHLLDETKYTQPAIFALGYALSKLWLSWGIKPNVVIGHSLGEYIAATIAGVFSLEDGLKLVAARANLMQKLPSNGEMVVIFASSTEVSTIIQSQAPEVTIAAINGPKNTVISGTKEGIQKTIVALKKEGVKTQKLKVSHAFHSPLMQPMISSFKQTASQISFSLPQIDLISNVTGQLVTTEIATPEYWCRHILEPVKFTTSMETLQREGYEALIECGSKPILLGMGRQCLPHAEAVWLPSLHQGKLDWEQMLESLGTLFVGGASIDWSGFEKCYHRRRLQLPTYPFRRERYWPSLANTEIADHPLKQTVTVNKSSLDLDINQQKLNASQLKSDTLNGEVVTEETITIKIKHLISEIAKIRTEELCLTSTFHEIGFDSLMLMEMKSKLTQSFSIPQSFPLKMFFGGATVKELINFIWENMQKVLSTEGSSPQSQIGLSSAMAQFQHWKEEFQPHKPIRIEKHFVHKAREENVLISKLRQLEKDSVVAEIVQDVFHSFFYEHPKEHVPGLYIIEAARQFGTVLSHLYYNVPLSRSFVLDEMQTQFYNFAETNEPLFAWAKVEDKICTNNFLSHMQIATSIIQDGEVIASVSGLFRIFKSSEYNNLRQKSLQSLKTG